MSNWAQINLVVDHSVRALCVKPYAGHTKGCPNFNRNLRCPGQAPLIEQILDLNKPTWVIWNVFPIGEHIIRMRQFHPEWSRRQLECCLYWQGKARKQLRNTITEFLNQYGPLHVLNTPEACGIDITATMKQIGIELEWPPVEYSHQVAVAGTII